MKYFSVPADYKKETIDAYAIINKTYKDSKIIETYGNISTEDALLHAGRNHSDIPKADMKDLAEYIEYSKLRNIDFNYTINGTCLGNIEFTESGLKNIYKLLDQLYSIGVRSLTVALPSLVNIIKESKYDFKIKASTLCQIVNPNKANIYKNMGFERIVVDESINREFSNLKRIVSVFGEKVELIVNTLCFNDCIYRPFHYNQMSHDSIYKEGKYINSYYNHLCMLKRCNRVENILKLSWIRPEDIKYYTSIGISYFKIQGRNMVIKGDPVRTVESYIKESFDGNLFDLLEVFSNLNSFKIDIKNKNLEGYIKPFYEVDRFCKRDCSVCGYCESFAKEKIDYEQAKGINDLATEFYNSFDEFTNTIHEIGNKDVSHSNEKLSNKIISNKAMDFDFN